MPIIVRSCLFEAAKLTKNDDPNKYGYSRYGIGFKACSQFWYSDGMWGENVAILVLIIVLLCIFVINENIDILILDKGLR